jgi:hypothetical protein
MNAEAFLKKLVTEVEPNATVVGVGQRVGAYHASVVGTTRRRRDVRARWRRRHGGGARG